MVLGLRQSWTWWQSGCGSAELLTLWQTRSRERQGDGAGHPYFPFKAKPLVPYFLLLCPTSWSFHLSPVMPWNNEFINVFIHCWALVVQSLLKSHLWILLHLEHECFWGMLLYPNRNNPVVSLLWCFLTIWQSEQTLTHPLRQLNMLFSDHQSLIPQCSLAPCIAICDSFKYI